MGIFFLIPPNSILRSLDGKLEWKSQNRVPWTMHGMLRDEFELGHLELEPWSSPAFLRFQAQGEAEILCFLKCFFDFPYFLLLKIPTLWGLNEDNHLHQTFIPHFLLSLHLFLVHFPPAAMSCSRWTWSRPHSPPLWCCLELNLSVGQKYTSQSLDQVFISQVTGKEARNGAWGYMLPLLGDFFSLKGQLLKPGHSKSYLLTRVHFSGLFFYVRPNPQLAF